VTATSDFAEILNSFVNSCLLYNGKAIDIHILVSPEFPEMYLRVLRSLGCVHIVRHDSLIEKDELRLRRGPLWCVQACRYKYAAWLARSYDVVSIYDCDAFVLSDLKDVYAACDSSDVPFMVVWKPNRTHIVDPVQACKPGVCPFSCHSVIFPSSWAWLLDSMYAYTLDTGYNEMVGVSHVIMMNELADEVVHLHKDLWLGLGLGNGEVGVDKQGLPFAFCEAGRIRVVHGKFHWSRKRRGKRGVIAGKMMDWFNYNGLVKWESVSMLF